MLTEIRINNSYIFNEEVTFSMKADMRSKRFGMNVHKEKNFNVLKSAALYGPNNSGKTCLINIMSCLKNIILNKPYTLFSNFFNEENKIAEIGVSFLESGHLYSYDTSIRIENTTGDRTCVYEHFSEITYDRAGREKKDTWFLRDILHGKYESKDTAFTALMPYLGPNNILIYLTNTEQFEILKKAQNILTAFASKIEIIDTASSNTLPFTNKTISILKGNSSMKEEVVDLIKNADLYLDDIKYDDRPLKGEDASESSNVPDVLRLVSSYKGLLLPSIIYDSEGTKRMEFLAGYIIEALHEDKILIIDELDTSLHFKLTRAIVSMFNSEVNDRSQLIFTTHDVSLLDCKKLLRKEQIWFINKDDERVYLYPLSVFTSDDNNIRMDTTDIAEKYRKGLLGSLPDPQLIKTLEKIKNNKEKY